jgi:hypothetical protein
MPLTFTGAARPRSPDILRQVAMSLAVETAVIGAIVSVETSGSGFDAHSRPKALFEPHRFYKELAGDPAKLQAAVAAGLAYPKWGERPYPPDSYDRIDRAMQIDETAALRATSWGLGQILGSNHALCGYDAPQAMVAAFAETEDAQILGMAGYLRACDLVGAMRARDWAGLAKGYNGTAYRANHYDTRLASAYARQPADLKAVPLPPLPRDRPEVDPAPVLVPVAAVGDPVPSVAPKPVETSLAPVSAPAAIDLSAVERHLQALGYDVVADGVLDPKTSDAILLFKARWNRDHADTPLPLDIDITPAVATALLATPLPPERTQATAADLRANGSIIANSATRLRQVGALVGVGGVGAGGLNAAADQIDAARRVSSSAHDLIVAVPSWAWIAVVAAIGGFVFLEAGRALKSRVEMHRKAEVA